MCGYFYPTFNPNRAVISISTAIQARLLNPHNAFNPNRAVISISTACQHWYRSRPEHLSIPTGLSSPFRHPIAKIRDAEKSTFNPNRAVISISTPLQRDPPRAIYSSFNPNRAVISISTYPYPCTHQPYTTLSIPTGLSSPFRPLIATSSIKFFRAFNPNRAVISISTCYKIS